MKKFLDFLNKVCGLFTEKQYLNLKKRYQDVENELDKHLRDDTSRKIFTNKLREQVKCLPYEFDLLLATYNPDQLNAFIYKAINHARNNEEQRELLERWRLRIEDAQKSLKKSEDPLKMDKITPSHFPGH